MSTSFVFRNLYSFLSSKFSEGHTAEMFWPEHMLPSEGSKYNEETKIIFQEILCVYASKHGRAFVRTRVRCPRAPLLGQVNSKYYYTLRSTLSSVPVIFVSSVRKANYEEADVSYTRRYKCTYTSKLSSLPSAQVAYVDQIVQVSIPRSLSSFSIILLMPPGKQC